MHLVLLLALSFFFYITGGGQSDYNKKTRRLQVILMGMCLFLFAALRSYTVGSDVPTYFQNYSIDADMSYGELLSFRAGRDPVFHVLCHLLSYIDKDPQILLVFVGAIVATGFSYYTYHQKGNVLLFFMLFVGLRMFSFTLSGLRQAVALGLVYVAYIQVTRSKVIKGILLTLIAGLFHTSAFVFLLAYPIIKFKKNGLFVAIVIGFVVMNLLTSNALVSMIALSTFEERFANYVARSQNMSFDGGFTFYIYLLFFIIMLVSYKQLKEKDAVFPENMRMMTVGVMFAFLGQSMDNVFRIAYYFIFVIMPIMSQIISTIVGNKKNEQIVFFLLSLALAIQYLALGTSAGVQDYQFFWDERYISN